MSEIGEFIIYASGFVYSSVCTSMDDAAATARMNAISPSGTETPWEIAAEPFRNGQANPHSCDTMPETHRHILFVVPSVDRTLRRIEDLATNVIAEHLP